MQVEMIRVEKLIPYARNPRHNDAAVDAVAASIKEFGFRQPIVVDEDMVILAGHTRLKVAHKLGLAAVPVHVATGLTDAQRKAYRIADNRVGELAEWDDGLLALEIEDLRMADFDLGTLAFDAGEIEALIAEANAVGRNSPIPGNRYAGPRAARSNRAVPLAGRGMAVVAAWVQEAAASLPEGAGAG